MHLRWIHFRYQLKELARLIVAFVAIVIIQGGLFIAQQLISTIQELVIFEVLKLIISTIQQLVSFKVPIIYPSRPATLIFSSLQLPFLIRFILIFPFQQLELQQPLFLFVNEILPLLLQQLHEQQPPIIP